MEQITKKGGKKRCAFFRDEEVEGVIYPWSSREINADDGARPKAMNEMMRSLLQ